MSTSNRVGFYLLKAPASAPADGGASPDGHGRLRLTCRLVETAWRHGHSVYVHTRDDAMAEQLDTLLWTWSDHSFIPHARYDQVTSRPAGTGDDDLDSFPVLIGSQQPADDISDVLIPLLDDIPDYYERFNRVMEPVDASDVEKKQARIRFRQYRDRGVQPETHDISPD